MIPEETAESVVTLSQRLTRERIPVPEALRYAMQLGDCLRRVHEGGHTHGAVSPQAVILEGRTLRLLPGDPADTEALAPYLAPERLQGCEPDVCSDIFSFGALLYELLTARPAFEGRSREILPPRIGHPGFDRIVSTCLSREPSGRWQRMQQVVMELKLLAASERRSETYPAQRQDQFQDALRNELRQVEERWAARLEQQQQTLADVSRSAAEGHARMGQVSESLKSVAVQLAGLETRLTDALERLTHAEQVAQATTESVGGIDRTVKAQAHDAAGIRAAMGRTEDLVERVVEALEGLQNMVIDQAGDDSVE